MVKCPQCGNEDLFHATTTIDEDIAYSEDAENWDDWGEIERDDVSRERHELIKCTVCNNVCYDFNV